MGVCLATEQLLLLLFFLPFLAKVSHKGIDIARNELCPGLLAPQALGCTIERGRERGRERSRGRERGVERERERGREGGRERERERERCRKNGQGRGVGGSGSRLKKASPFV